MSPRASGADSGLSFRRLHASIARDAYSDFLPLVAWVEEEEVVPHGVV